MFQRIRFLLNLTKAHSIARRYFFTNGYDGALTMLGLLMGFYASGGAPVRTAISACMGAAIALCISGLSSAYISESEERKKELGELENALIDDLSDTDFSRAMKWTPVWIAFVNGFAPFLISLFIIIPLWLAQFGISLPLPPLELAIASALFVIFLLGIFLGKATGTFWLATGFRALLIAVVTCLVILCLEF